MQAQNRSIENSFENIDREAEQNIASKLVEEAFRKAETASLTKLTMLEAAATKELPKISCSELLSSPATYLGVGVACSWGAFIGYALTSEAKLASASTLSKVLPTCIGAATGAAIGFGMGYLYLQDKQQHGSRPAIPGNPSPYNPLLNPLNPASPFHPDYIPQRSFAK